MAVLYLPLTDEAGNTLTDDQGQPLYAFPLDYIVVPDPRPGVLFVSCPFCYGQDDLCTVCRGTGTMSRVVSP